MRYYQLGKKLKKRKTSEEDGFSRALGGQAVYGRVVLKLAEVVQVGPPLEEKVLHHKLEPRRDHLALPF